MGFCSILSTPPQADKALENMQKALEINPDDGEVCYNLGQSHDSVRTLPSRRNKGSDPILLYRPAAVLEATGELEEALIAFQRADKLGIERAKTNIRNVSDSLARLVTE